MGRRGAAVVVGRARTWRILPAWDPMPGLRAYTPAGVHVGAYRQTRCGGRDMTRLTRWIGLVVVVGGCITAAVRVVGAGAAGAAKAPWPEILGPAQGPLPAAQDKVVWRPELAPALAEAA